MRVKTPFIGIIILCIMLPASLLPMTWSNQGPGRFDFTSDKTQIEIPFYTFNNQVILSVEVNDLVALNFILDSGASQAILFDRKLATNIGIGLGRKIQFSGVGNGHRVTAFRSKGVKLVLPGIEGTMMGMAVLNSDYLDMGRFDIHGIIGYQLFTRFAIKIDYQKRLLTLMEPEQYDPSEYHAFDLQIENSKPYLNSDVYLENQREVPLKLMIDTGAAFGLSLITGTHPAIQIPTKSRKTWLADGLGGKLRGFRSQAILKLSTTIHPEVETFYIEGKDYSQRGSDPVKMGSIGCHLLKNYVVIIDYVNSKIFFQIQSTPYVIEPNPALKS